MGTYDFVLQINLHSNMLPGIWGEGVVYEDNVLSQTEKCGN